MKGNVDTRKGSKPTSLILSTISVFAVLNVLSGLIPVTPILGFEQSRLTLSWVFASLTGLMLGPRAGSLSCLLATLLESFIGFTAVAPFGPFGLARSALAAFETGLLTTRYWKFSAGLLLFLIVGWLSIPQGQEAASILVFHVLGLSLICSLQNRVSRGLESSDRKTLGLVTAVATYCGNITRHLYGNILLAIVGAFPASIFLVAMPLTLIEQALFAVLSAALGSSLIHLGLRRVTYIG